MDPIFTFFSGLDPTVLPLGAMVTLFVVGLLRGWVVPRQVLIDRIADKDSQIAALGKERDDWRSAYQISDAAKNEVIKQNGSLIEAGETTQRLMESLRNQIERTSGPLPPTQRHQEEV
jgi:hypothetical protein